MPRHCVVVGYDVYYLITSNTVSHHSVVVCFPRLAARPLQRWGRHATTVQRDGAV